jgi:4-methylaminobutanoate oxidase (formaldehyde-forming)
VPVLAQRVTFVGELGWELYAPTDYVLTLWDTLLEAGAPLGVRPAGYRAIEAMRLEKSYRVWGSDITPETTPDEAGLGFAVRVARSFSAATPCWPPGPRPPPGRPPAGCAASPSTIRAWSASAPNRCASTAIRAAGSPPAVTASASASPSRTRTCRPQWPPGHACSWGIWRLV